MRILSEPPRDNTWLEYHEEMTEKHRYLVRGNGFKPFYTDELLDDIKTLLGGEIRLIDVVNCDWQRDRWREQPYKYRFINNGNKYEWYAHPSTLKPNHPSYSPTGLRLNDEWLELNYSDTLADTYTTFTWGSDGHCSIIHASKSVYRTEKGVWYWRIGGESVELDGMPADALLPQARRINAEKWGGFYAPIIEFLVEEGMNRTQI